MHLVTFFLATNTYAMPYYLQEILMWFGRNIILYDVCENGSIVIETCLLLFKINSQFLYGL